LVQGRGVYRSEATYEDPDRQRGRVIFPSVWKDPTGRWLAVYGTNWSPFPLCALESDDGIRWKNAPLDGVMRQPLRLEMKFYGANVYGLPANWQWLDSQGMYMLEDGKPIAHLLELRRFRQARKGGNP
jgi:hypothetical protein